MTQSTTQNENPLGYKPIHKLLAAFALPAVVSMLVNAVYNIVDQIFIGQGVGPIGNAATTVSFPLVTIVLSVGTLLGSGGSSFAALKLGEKSEKDAEKALGNVFFLSISIGLIIAVLGILFLEPLLMLFGASADNLGYAKDYSFILLLGTPFNMLAIGLSNMARTDGNPKLSMFSMLLGAVINTILDPIYIFVFHWGVKGAAIATITSQIISSVILTVYFIKKGNMRLRKVNLKLNPIIYKPIVTLGISSCITQLAATLMQIVMNNSLVLYGKQSGLGSNIPLSAMGIVLKISMIITSICIGISVGTQPILGFNQGAGKFVRVRKAYLTAAGTATIFSIIGWSACMLIPNIILSVFGTGDAQFTEFAQKCMRIYMSGTFCVGLQIISTSYFQATGQPLKASLLSMMRQLILLIPLILILPRFMGIDGILYAGPIADISSGIMVFILISFEMKKLNNKIKSQLLLHTSDS